MEKATVDVCSAARTAAEQSRWRQAYERLQQADVGELTPDALELFADAAWWCCRVDEEIDLRQRAFAGFVAAGAARRAAYAAWLLSVRHGLRGDPTAASGWLRRAERQLAGVDDGVEHGFVACSQAEQALREGALAEAESCAERAVALGERFAEPALVALALSWQGLCKLASHDLAEGLRRLDEAMASVMAGELDAHFTGWVYCFAIGMCVGVADLHRASRWAQAAWAWASALPETTPYQGLCRVRLVEVMSWCGELDAAEAEARVACEEMLAFEPPLAGEAFYALGEIRRRKGDLAAAERAFTEARELGHDPQPGLARIRLAQGRATAAASALRAALADPGRPPLVRTALLAAQLEAALTTGDRSTARRAGAELDAVAAEVGSDALAAVAGQARGRMCLVEGDAETALAALRAAAATWRALAATCELAEVRTLIALALRELGDREGAHHELDVARRLFARTGAAGDARRLAGLVEEERAAPAGLTDREREVLRQVAAGRTNRQIAAALVISEHTVARHVRNIFGKIGVSSRTAAAAFAYEHGVG